MITAKEMTREQRIARIQKLIDQFTEGKQFFMSNDFVESECRSKFIDPFLECLGWDVKNEKGARHDRQEVITEDRVEIEGAIKHPDYTLCYGGERKFYIEAKQPSVKLKTDPEPARQVRRYAYTSKMPIAVLTDFQELVIYDTRIKPKYNDGPEVARIDYYTYEQYVEKFDEIYNKISWDAVDLGKYDSYHEGSKDKRGTSSVDDDILAMIEGWRITLAEFIALKNGTVIDDFNLTGAVQKIIDRILFLRICEDKEIEERNTLKNIADSKVDIYAQLKVLFAVANQKFNAGLFATDTFLDSLIVPDKSLKDIINALYYPLCPYEFSVLPVEILGSIYERFLGKTIRLGRKTKYGHSVYVEEKPEVQKAGGVYYTPSYIVRYIVEQTIGKKLIEAGTPEKASSIKVCDPACGSGSFLVGAYQYLLDWHLDYYDTDEHRDSAEKRGTIYKDARTHEYKLSVEEKRRILLNNIYGVDIDAQAVEVTELSLFLKLLENEGKALSNTGQSVSSRNKNTQKILPDLKNNIKCGNSLVGSDYYADKDMTLFGIAEQRKINVFDWEEKFAHIFANGGFDCIIGNPPYVSAPNQIADDILRSQREYLTTCGKYQLIYQKWDLYIPFMEKSLQLLKDAGLYGAIVPFPLSNQTYGKLLRQALVSDYDLYEITDLKGVKVFAHASVSNCIPFVKKASPSGNVNISHLGEEEIISVSFTKTLNELVQDEKTQVWNLTQEKREANRHADMHVLGDFCYISKGMVLNSNEKTAKGEFKKEDLISAIQDNVARRQYIEAKDITAYKINRIRYLEYGTDRSPAKLSRPTFPELYELPKLVFNILGELTGTYDNEKIVHNNSLIACVLWKDLHDVENKSIASSIKKFSRHSREEMEKLSKKVDLRYLLAIMNSRYAKVLLANIRGGDYHIYPEHIRNIPIPLPDKQSLNKLVNLANQRMDAAQQLASAKSPSDQQFLQQRCNILDKQINTAVYKLYGLTEDEIAIVEK